MTKRINFITLTLTLTFLFTTTSLVNAQDKQPPQFRVTIPDLAPILLPCQTPEAVGAMGFRCGDITYTFTPNEFSNIIALQAPTKFYRVRGIGASNGTILAGGFALEFRNAAARNLILDAFTDAYAYQATIADPNNPGQTIPNPVGKQPFFNRIIRDYIRDVVQSREIKAAEDAARAAAAGTIDTDLPNGG